MASGHYTPIFSAKELPWKLGDRTTSVMVPPPAFLAQLKQPESGLAAALAARNQQSIAATRSEKPKKPKAQKSATSDIFQFDEDLQAFLFFAEGESHSDLVPHVDGDRIIIPLAPCAYRMTDYTFAKQEPLLLDRCVAKLNVLRCLQRECGVINELLVSTRASMEEDELGKVRFMELLSNCGVYQKVSELILQNVGNGVSAKPIMIVVDGLDTFLDAIEKQVPSIAAAREEIEFSQTVSFYPGLGELFNPGSKLVCFPEGMEGSPLGCSCVQSWYSEETNPATGKTKRRFVLVIEFIVSVGDELVFVAATDVYPEFHDTSRSIPVKDLTHRKLLNTEEDQALLERLQQRGEFYASVAVKNHYLEYQPDSFFPIIGGGWKSNTVRPLSKGGRVMVDVKRSIVEGHIAVRGSDGLSDTVREATKLHEQSKRTGVAVPFRTCVLPGFHSSCASGCASDVGSLWQSWPILTGFSFTARVWGKLLLGMPRTTAVLLDNSTEPEVSELTGKGSCGNCGYIKFQEKAFDQLVLAEDKKELIRAVARNASGKTYTFEESLVEDDGVEDVGLDVVANKGGASIFLLHGPPGCGKTLTAEAISELLRKPLYIVTAGDLGITASEVEKTLGAVLDLCQTWDALVLIDEADIFLEARNSTEIHRNALVCVMLRLLEYYSGCLFLASNRAADSIDAAIASRITVMLGYPPLDAGGRQQVWKNLIELLPVLPEITKGEAVSRPSKYRMKFTESEYADLGSAYKLNGRQIKNSIVLARALARERGQPLCMDVLKRAVLAVAGSGSTLSVN